MRPGPSGSLTISFLRIAKDEACRDARATTGKMPVGKLEIPNSKLETNGERRGRDARATAGRMPAVPHRRYLADIIQAFQAASSSLRDAKPERRTSSA